MEPMAAAPGGLTPGQTRSICADQPMPAGFVVVGTASSAACGNHTGIAIRPLESPMTMCVRRETPDGWVAQPIPAGYAVVSATRSSACPRVDGSVIPNELTIRAIESPMGICARWRIRSGASYPWAVSSIPAGYLIVSASSSTSCPDSSAANDRLNVFTIRAAESPMSICARWSSTDAREVPAIPEGYLIVSASRSPTCQEYGDHKLPNVYVIRTPESPMAICARWRGWLGFPVVWSTPVIPAGYVVVSASSSSACPDPPTSPSGLPNVFTIRTVESSSSMCAGWKASAGYQSLIHVIQPVPAGYVVVGASQSSACPSFGELRPNVLAIQALVSPILICARLWTPAGLVNQSTPPGYEVVGTSISSACPDYPTKPSGRRNAYTIRQV
jgi:hypothetical protein